MNRINIRISGHAFKDSNGWGSKSSDLLDDDMNKVIIFYKNHSNKKVEVLVIVLGQLIDKKVLKSGEFISDKYNINIFRNQIIEHIRWTEVEPNIQGTIGGDAIWFCPYDMNIVYIELNLH